MGRMSSSEHPGAPRHDAAAPDPRHAEGDVPDAAAPPRELHVNWVYGLLAVVLLALGFGVWGALMVFGSRSGEDPLVMQQRVEQLQQQVTTLARSDQISREANRELQGALAEREEEVAALRAEVAFYERFVGSTAERSGLAVHELQLRPGEGPVWHFTTTLTQTLERGQPSEGGVTLLVEGSRNGRMEQLEWTDLRQQEKAAPVAYSFKYFQQVEGDIVLPAGFTPARVTVRAAPARGSAVEQSFAWADATGRSSPGA